MKNEETKQIEKLAQQSELTKKDVEEFSKKVNNAAPKRFLSESN